MPKRSSKPRPDENEAAFEAVRALTGGDEPDEAPPEKNPHAQALGSLGGKKGGPARAKKLSKKRRVEIARKAARKRWKGKKKR